MPPCQVATAAVWLCLSPYKVLLLPPSWPHAVGSLPNKSPQLCGTVGSRCVSQEAGVPPWQATPCPCPAIPASWGN